jgi:hypothetical protein
MNIGADVRYALPSSMTGPTVLKRYDCQAISPGARKMFAS